MATKTVTRRTLGHVLIRAEVIPMDAHIESVIVKPNGRIVVNAIILTPGGVVPKEYSLLNLSAPDVVTKPETNEDGVTIVR